MNSLLWGLANSASSLLDPAEREAVCGDLAEVRTNGPAALKGVLGLVARRQFALWTKWRPWLALTGIVMLVGFFLGRSLAAFSTSLFLQLRTYFRYGVHYETGGVTPLQDACHLTIWALTLFAWSWAGGFVLASLSKRTLWLTASLFYVAVQDAFLICSLIVGSTVIGNPHAPLWLLLLARLLPLDPALLLFLPGMILGAYRGTRETSLALKPAIIFTVITFVLMYLLFWSSGWYDAAFEKWSNITFPVTPWPFRLLPLLLAGWPAAFTPFLSRRFKIGVSE